MSSYLFLKFMEQKQNLAQNKIKNHNPHKKNMNFSSGAKEREEEKIDEKFEKSDRKSSANKSRCTIM